MGMDERQGRPAPRDFPERAYPYREPSYLDNKTTLAVLTGAGAALLAGAGLWWWRSARK